MRSRKDVANSNRRNETKYAILKALSSANKHLTPAEIANKCNLSLQAVKSALTRLYKWHYIWRSTNRKHGKNWFVYRHPKPKGIRVLKKFEELLTAGKPLKIR